MQNIGLYVIERQGKLLGQSVEIIAIPVMNATHKHTIAFHCDSPSYHSTKAELYFQEI